MTSKREQIEQKLSFLYEKLEELEELSLTNQQANFLMNVSENNAARGHAAAMLATQNNINISNYNKRVKDGFWAGLGEAIFNII